MSSRRRKGHAAEHHVDERWLVSYADMITVLMALFIVLYAMSTVDSHKYDQLKNSLATGFGQTKTTKVDSSTTIVPKEDVTKKGAGLSATTLAAKQEAEKAEKALAKAGATATVTHDSASVTISLVGSSAYFGGNSADLRPATTKVLTAIVPILKQHDGKITVEGHASPQGSSGPYGNDWTLASDRALQVLYFVVNDHSVKASKISAVSYGSENANTSGSAAQMAKNRRVDIVLHQPTAEATTETAAADTSKKTDTKTDTKTATKTEAKSTSSH